MASVQDFPTPDREQRLPEQEMPETSAELRRERAFLRPFLQGSVSGLFLLTMVAVRPHPNRVDVAVTRWLQRRTSPRFFAAMRLISAPGYAPFTHSSTLGLSAALWGLGYRREGVLCLSLLGAGTTTGVLKVIVRRPRPGADFKLMQKKLRDKSFPSGHATHYSSFYGFIFWFAYRRLRPSWLRTTILVFCATMIALVGPSRVYLGHHWASDVIAGELVGFSYLLTALEIDLMLRDLVT